MRKITSDNFLRNKNTKIYKTEPYMNKLKA